MISDANRIPPRWTGPLARILALTFLSALISFAVALLLSILGTVLHARLQHVSPDLMFAYKRIAFPIAVSAGAVVLFAMTAIEIRNYRQSRVLDGIAQAALKD